MQVPGQPVGGTGSASVSGSGFSLVELLVVIAILGLLSGLVVPAVVGVRQQVNVKICAHNLRGISNALQFYGDQYKRFPPALDAVQIGGVYYKRSAHDFLTPYMGHADELMQMPLHWPSKIARYRPGAFTCPAAEREQDGFHFALAPGIFHQPRPPILVAGHQRIPSRPFVADSFLAFMADGTSETLHMLTDEDGTVHGLDIYRHARGTRTRLTPGANYLFADGHVEFSDAFHLHELSEAPWKLTESVP